MHGLMSIKKKKNILSVIVRKLCSVMRQIRSRKFNEERLLIVVNYFSLKRSNFHKQNNCTVVCSMLSPHFTFLCPRDLMLIRYIPWEITEDSPVFREDKRVQTSDHTWPIWSVIDCNHSVLSVWSSFAFLRHNYYFIFTFLVDLAVVCSQVRRWKSDVLRIAYYLPFIRSFIPQSPIRQVHSLFKSEFSTECDTVIRLSISGTLSFR
jgi:hypothetical protein